MAFILQCHDLVKTEYNVAQDEEALSYEDMRMDAAMLSDESVKH